MMSIDRRSGRSDSVNPLLPTGGSRTRLGRRIPPAALLAGCVLLSTWAFAARRPVDRIVLTTIDALLLVTLCPGPLPMAYSLVRWFAWQTATIVGLHLLRFGVEGWVPGITTSWQLLLAFLPGMIFLRAVPSSRLLDLLNRIMPHRAAFVVGTSIRSVPVLISEARRIREAQILRGARILPRDLMRPWNWPDLARCLLVPLIIRSLALAADLARAAAARDFGCGRHRTSWPGP